MLRRFFSFADDGSTIKNFRYKYARLPKDLEYRDQIFNIRRHAFATDNDDVFERISKDLYAYITNDTHPFLPTFWRHRVWYTIRTISIPVVFFFSTLVMAFQLYWLLPGLGMGIQSYWCVIPTAIIMRYIKPGLLVTYNYGTPTQAFDFFVTSGVMFEDFHEFPEMMEMVNVIFKCRFALIKLLILNALFLVMIFHPHPIIPDGGEMTWASGERSFAVIVYWAAASITLTLYNWLHNPAGTVRRISETIQDGLNISSRF